jgi:chemotaxis protein CheD
MTLPLKPGARLPVRRSAQGIYVLHPGDIACADEGDRLQTLLGSCVSVCLNSPRRHVGGMCHIMYSGPTPPVHKHNTAYAEPAMRKLFADLRAKGVNPLSCEAYVYGGGSMFSPDGTVSAANARVGERNVAWALAFLADSGIVLRGKSVGGTQYRKVDWLVGAEAPEVRVAAVERAIR